MPLPSPRSLTETHLRFMNIGSRCHKAHLGELLPFQSKPLHSYTSKLHRAVVRGYGLYLWGSNGTGKTYISAALCKRVWGKYSISSYMITAAELKECWIDDHVADTNIGTQDTVIQRVQRIGFLVIDDLGKEYRAASGFAENKFGALLRHRSSRNLSTVITSNLPPKEFKETYGDSAYDLMVGCMRPTKLEGNSQRLKIEASEMKNFFED